MEEENGRFGRRRENVYIAVCGGRRGSFEAFAALGECYMCHSAGEKKGKLV